MTTLAEIVNKFQLISHPEGGFYKRTYCSKTPFDATSRGVGSSIFYLLGPNDFSSFHRLDHMDELWFFHGGSPLTIHDIDLAGNLTTHLLSSDNPQLCIPAKHWFCAETLEKNVNSYSFVSCCVLPEFDFKFMELGNRQTLIDLFPNCKEVITKFTRT